MLPKVIVENALNCLIGSIAMIGVLGLVPSASAETRKTLKMYSIPLSSCPITFEARTDGTSTRKTIIGTQYKNPDEAYITVAERDKPYRPDMTIHIRCGASGLAPACEEMAISKKSASWESSSEEHLIENRKFQHSKLTPIHGDGWEGVVSSSRLGFTDYPDMLTAVFCLGNDQVSAVGRTAKIGDVQHSHMKEFIDILQSIKFVRTDTSGVAGQSDKSPIP
jgi:hypothetical protein